MSVFQDSVADAITTKQKICHVEKFQSIKEIVQDSFHKKEKLNKGKKQIYMVRQAETKQANEDPKMKQDQRPTLRNMLVDEKPSERSNKTDQKSSEDADMLKLSNRYIEMKVKK